MACPYFVPREPWLSEGRRRSSLGVPHRGACQLDPQQAAVPDEHADALCNRGYARGRCSRFPADAPSDALRYSVVAREGDLVRFVWIAEREHAPVEHGTSAYHLAAGTFEPDPPGGAKAQARAFLLTVCHP